MHVLSVAVDAPDAFDSLVEILRSDPAMAANVIHLANSAAYHRGKPVGCVAEAVLRVGLEQARSVALSLSLFGPFLGCSCAEDLWRHSFMAAVGVRIMCRAMPLRVRPPEDQAFLCGLLHDFGFLAFSLLNPVGFESFRANLCRLDAEESLTVERQLFGMSHPEMGAAVAGRWGIPAETVEAIRWHHEPEAVLAGWHLPALVHAVEQVLLSAGNAGGPEPDGFGLAPDFIARLGLSVPEFATLGRQLLTQAQLLDGFIASFAES